MASRFQACSLVASPLYPNAIAWSDENLVAVATGHLVTILNPAFPFGPRGLITLPDNKFFPIGIIERKDLLSGSLLPTCLSRDYSPRVRSISWSPLGLAPNAGCLLAVCTTEGRVKLYRPPFCEFRAEWVEVIDISDMLYDYLAKISFGELDIASSEFSDGLAAQVGVEHVPDDMPISFLIKGCKRIDNKNSRTLGGKVTYAQKSKDATPCTEWSTKSNKLKENNRCQIASAPKSKAKRLKTIPEDPTLPLISADQYASRSAMLSSLVVAWSPLLQSYGNMSITPKNSSNCCSVLATGGKSGKVSFWRFFEPPCYSIEHSRVPITVVPVGLLQAHNTWITAISWALLSVDALNPLVLLVTGSSDGSVKIWRGYCEELIESYELREAPFCLLKEVITDDSVPVSVLSVIVPVQSLHKMQLAIGKGSGSFDVWIYDISTTKFDKVGSYDAHEHVVTGLVWAFDGSCLYSCSQDNSVRSWILCGDALCEVPIPPNTPRLNSSSDLPNVSDSCFGLAVSSGNLVLAVARSLDVAFLNPMYQARTQKAAVEFFWIGGQQLDISAEIYPDYNTEAFSGFPEEELFNWESNLLWSLKQLEHPDKPLVVWDIIASLSAFKQSAPKYVEHILIEWLATSYVGSHISLSTEEILARTSKIFRNISSRQLHLLNIVCTRVVSSEPKDKINLKQKNVKGLYGAEEDQLTLWMELLMNTERELRERLVGFSFSTVLSLVSHSSTNISEYWHPVGLAQMEQWVALNHDYVDDRLKLIASKVGKLDSRLCSTCDYIAIEQCNYCPASVPFESPEVAFCQGGVSGRSHKLTRCSVSMRVCPTTPLWFCTCCQRWASKLAPHSFFKMPRYPLDCKTEFKNLDVLSKPMCPFCGILLQRLQPDFLLSASPV